MKTSQYRTIGDLDIAFYYQGEGDLYLNSVITTRLHEDIPGSEIVRIKTGGHFIQEDEPELLSSLIDDFFKKHSKK